MLYKEYKIIYEKITKNLGIQVKDDEKASNILDKLLQNRNLISVDDLENLIDGKEVIVFGAGPSLETSLYSHKKEYKNKIKIAADGTTTALLKNDILPDIIITDLDGKISDQIKANSKGSIVAIHAHGDNIDKLEEYVPKFKKNLVGTTQINPEPYNNLHNFFGFTDGDRAIYLANHFNAKKIDIIGFDFDGKIGKYSFATYKDKTLKLKKLKWCKYFIDLLKKENKNIQYL